jgi:hypothetical protein
VLELISEWWLPYSGALGPLGILFGGTVAFLSLIFAWISFRRSIQAEIRRKTLEACESFLLRDPAWPAISRVVIAVRQGEFPLDTYPEKPGSLRIDVSLVLNNLETIALGVRRRFYSRSVAKEYLREYTRYFYSAFLSDDRAHPPTMSLRWHDADVPNFRAVFGYSRHRGANAVRRAAEVGRMLDPRLKLGRWPFRAWPDRDRLLGVARRFENDTDPNRRRRAHQMLHLLGDAPRKPEPAAAHSPARVSPDPRLPRSTA